MSNVEGMTGMPNGEKVMPGRIRHSGFAIDSSFSARSAFTLIELIVVTAVIIILTGLVLSTVGYVQKKGARARAETEIAAISAACESYKADNGTYPRGPGTAITIGTVTIPANVTDSLDARTMGNPTSNTNPTYGESSLYLYTLLSGDSTGNRSSTTKSYMQFKPNMLLPAGGTGTVIAISDPFGNSYGYSTANQDDPNNLGYNPTFDLWSTGGETGPRPSETFQQYQLRWIKNW